MLGKLLIIFFRQVVLCVVVLKVCVRRCIPSYVEFATDCSFEDQKMSNGVVTVGIDQLLFILFYNK